MKKIAIVNQRYGLEVNGGSEYYARQIAERLTAFYDVEVITSKAKDYKTWSNFYSNDVECINGVTVRRFTVEKERGLAFRIVNRILRTLNFHPQWFEKIWIEKQGPYCPKAVEYLEEQSKEYDAIIFITYLYYPTAIGLPKLHEKAIFVPTAHDEPFIYYSIYNEVFKKAQAIVYLTEEEKRFVHKRFNNEHIMHRIMGAGVDLPTDINQQRFREKYGIDGDFFIYVGRVDASKGCDHMIQYFKEYKCSSSSDVKLVIIGQVMMDIEPDPDIKVLGFVEEQDKFDGIQGAKALILPSEFESLSIAVLESLALGRPVIVNGKCEVLKAHCDKSQAGLAYQDKKTFIESLKFMLNETQAYEQMSLKAKKYIEKNYCWKTIIDQYCELIEMVSNNNRKE